MLFWCIESIEQLKTLASKNYQSAFVKVIPSNYNVHPAINDISLVYVKPLDAKKGYMLCLNHGV